MGVVLQLGGSPYSAGWIVPLLSIVPVESLGAPSTAGWILPRPDTVPVETLAYTGTVGVRGFVGEAGDRGTQFVHGRSRMTIDLRIPTMPGGVGG